MVTPSQNQIKVSSAPPDKTKSWIRKVGLIILTIVIAFLVFIGIMVYGFSWQNKFTYQVSRIIPIPIGRVEGQTLWLKDWYIVIKTTPLFPQNIIYTNVKNVDQLGFLRLVDEVYINKYAQAHKLSVNPAELNTAFNSLYKYYGSQQKFSQRYQKLGLSQAQINQQVSDAVLLVQVWNQLANNPTAEKQALSKAQAVINQVNSGTPFSVLAEQNSVSSDEPASGQVLLSSLPLPIQEQTGMISGKVSLPSVYMGSVYLFDKPIVSDKKVLIHVIKISFGDIDAWSNQQASQHPVTAYIPLLKKMQ